VAAGLLPPEVIHRKKLGFPTPLRQWLLHPESEAIYRSLTDRSGFLPSIMNMKPLQELIVRHRSGIEDATDRLWRLLNLQHWGDLFLAGGDRRFLNERADSASRRSLSGAGS
jgi:asparagine synthase (glutamine-hydrolysing)